MTASVKKVSSKDVHGLDNPDNYSHYSARGLYSSAPVPGEVRIALCGWKGAVRTAEVVAKLQICPTCKMKK
jgi:hypothetical protein